MNDEGSQRYAHEESGEHLPPPLMSRWRFIAVMLAMVLGCGVSAVLVHSGALVIQTAEQAGQTDTVKPPRRTSAQVPISDQERADRGVGTPTPAGAQPAPNSTSLPGGTPAPGSRSESATVAPRTTTARVTPPGGPSTTRPQAPSSPPATTTTSQSCLLGLVC